MGWKIIGASTPGKYHLIENIPCQDAFKIKELTHDTGIVALSDGAGSYSQSHIGSSFLVSNSLLVLQEFFQQIENPVQHYSLTPELWKEDSLKIMFQIQENLRQYSLEIGIDFFELSATLIFFYFSPELVLAAHIGDGRAGYRNAYKQWYPIIKPYLGNEPGSTAFVTDNFQKHDLLESVIIKDNITAFTVLSDGCEKICWETLKQEDDEKYSVANNPFEIFFETCISSFIKGLEAISEEEIKIQWQKYLSCGHPVLEKENDDKTLVIGFFNTACE